MNTHTHTAGQNNRILMLKMAKRCSSRVGDLSEKCQFHIHMVGDKFFFCFPNIYVRDGHKILLVRVKCGADV